MQRELLSFIVQVAGFLSSVGLIIVTLLQVTKAETGGAGSMGIGSLGGRAANTPVGQERILKPLTMWCGVTFVFSATLLAIPRSEFDKVAPVAIIVFGFVMGFRHTIGAWLRESLPNIFGDE